MAFDQAALDVFGQLVDIFVCGVEQQRFQRDGRSCVVGEAELVEDAQLVVLLELGGFLAGRAAQCLLLLDVVGEVAEGLWKSVSHSSYACCHVESVGDLHSRPCAGPWGSA